MKKFILVIIAFCVIFTGCSRMDMAYSFAPRLTANQLEDAFDLSSSRYHKIKDRIENDLKSNKGEIKSGLISLIDSVSTVSDKKKLSTEELKGFFATGKDLQVRLITLLRPSFEEVLGAMSRDELEHLKSYSEEKFKKSGEKLESAEKFRKAGLKNFEKHMETFFNSVTDEQLLLYGNFLNENFEYFKYQLTVRQSFVNRLDSLFETKPEMVNYVVKYYSGDSSVKSEEFRKKQEVYLQSAFAVAESIWASLTDKQRAEFKDTLAGMRADLSKL
jgi:hypothetical protein